MDWIDYLRVLRHRWKVVAAAVLLALIAAWVTTSVTPIGLGSSAPLYRATTVLINTGSLDALFLNNFETAAALTTVGEVPRRVAAILKTSESPVSLAGKIEAAVDAETAVLRISATSPDQKRAELMADTFATELIGYLADRKVTSIATQADALTKQLSQLVAEIETLERRVLQSTGSRQAIARTERDSKIRQYGFIYESFIRIRNTAAEPGQLQVIQEAEGLPLSGGGFSAPRSRSSRLMLGGILGLMAGAAVALVLERVDTRIRTKDQAEEAFALPALAEIPLFAHTGSSPSVQTVTHPSSAATHCFRLLRGSIMQEARLRAGWDGNGEGRFSGTFLVTSAAPGDGKTTVVANLAPVFAEIGLSVLILSCDFRRPEVHRYYRVPNHRGLVDALEATDGWRILSGMALRTQVRDVRLVPSGPVPENPGELMSSDWMRDVLKEARQTADVVLIDTPPILAASDATHLLPQVDGVLVVCRAGRSTAEVAKRTTEMLRRLGANPLGVVLNGLRSGSLMARGYYEYAGGTPRRGLGRIVKRARRVRPPAAPRTDSPANGRPPRGPTEGRPTRAPRQTQEAQEPWEARRARDKGDAPAARQTPESWQAPEPRTQEPWQAPEPRAPEPRPSTEPKAQGLLLTPEARETLEIPEARETPDPRETLEPPGTHETSPATPTEKT